MVQLSPAIATDQLHVSSSGYGALLAAFGAGSVVMALLLAVHAERFKRSDVAIVGLAGSVLALACVAATGQFELALAAFLLLGLSSVMIVISLNTAMQFQLDDAYRGRVMSIYLMGVLLGPPIGTTVLGAVAQQTSTQVATGLAAALLGTYALVAISRFDRLRGLDVSDGRPDDAHTVASSTPAAAGGTA